MATLSCLPYFLPHQIDIKGCLLNTILNAKPFFEIFIIYLPYFQYPELKNPLIGLDSRPHLHEIPTLDDTDDLLIEFPDFRWNRCSTVLEQKIEILFTVSRFALIELANTEKAVESFVFLEFRYCRHAAPRSRIAARRAPAPNSEKILFP